MIELFRRNRFFIVPYLIFLVISSYFLILYTKEQVHIFMNQFHHPVADKFFMYITYLGDGVIVAVLIALLLFVSYRYALIMLSSVLFTTIVIQVLKRIVFAALPRPRVHFRGIYELYFVPGVDVLEIYSFPSGHAASAFGVFFMLSLITKNSSLKFLYFVIAFLISYSRVYLSHHFLVDIYFGSLISVFFCTVMFYLGMKWKNPKFDNSLSGLILSVLKRGK